MGLSNKRSMYWRCSTTVLIEDLCTDGFVEPERQQAPQLQGISPSLDDVKAFTERGGTTLKQSEQEQAVPRPLNSAQETKLRGSVQDKESDHLTPREQEIVRLLADGKSKKEIAEKIMTTWGNVKTHCKNISRKWGLDTTVQATMQKVARERLQGEKNPPSTP